jgi:hypothetical protein
MDVVYRIDAQDRIAFVNQEWDRFAAGNAAPDLQAPSILARSLWDFISDGTTRHLYRDILKRVRGGGRARFPFRCDGPDLRRFLEMDASPLEAGSVEFRVRTLSVEPRAFQPLLDGGAKRSGEMVRMCGWCKKVSVDGWVEVEEAIALLKLFESAELPMLTHGICESCDARMRTTMAVPRRAGGLSAI